MSASWGGRRRAADEYERRFPALSAVLVEQIRLHDAIGAEDGLQSAAAHSSAVPDAPLEAARPLGDTDATYEILEQIGAGGMGVVYKARQAALDRFVALKMVAPRLTPAIRSCFLAFAPKRVSSPRCIIPIIVQCLRLRRARWIAIHRDGACPRRVAG